MQVKGSSFQVKEFCSDRKYAGESFNQQFLLPACRRSNKSKFIIPAGGSHGCKPVRPALRVPAASLRELERIKVGSRMIQP